jgi:uncharacterized circularly permuted ATP-grasp superfamily protein
MLKSYQTEGFFDEMVDVGKDVRPHYRRYRQLFGQMSLEEFKHKRHSLDLAFLRQGVTFNVYGDSQGMEKIFPRRNGRRSSAVWCSASPP